MRNSLLWWISLAVLSGSEGVIGTSNEHTIGRPSLPVLETSGRIRPAGRAFVRKIRSTSTAVARLPRGGDCSDSHPTLFFKVGLSALVQSSALFGILFASIHFKDVIPVTVFREPLLELLASFSCIFGSSFVGAAVDGSLSAATNQALNPTKVQGSQDWYANLRKPSWTPPGWVFPIMWLIVSKPTQLCAMSRIFKYGIDSNDGSAIPVLPLLVYTTTLALGDTWNKVFFGLECIGQGTVVISLYFAMLIASAGLFFQIDAVAGYYMLPTCAWVAVATALQYSIFGLNKGKK